MYGQAKTESFHSFVSSMEEGEEEEELTMKEESQQILRVLEALKQASQELQANPIGNSVDSDSPSPAIEALLQLGETESDSILASDPRLSALSRHLSDLKSLVNSLHESKRGRFTSFLTRRVRSNAISRVAGSIEAEIKAWIDREAVRGLTCHLRRLRALETPLSSREAAAIEEKLTNFHDKLAQGFDLNFQDLLLRSRIFPELEFVVCSENLPKGVRENAAYALKQLVLFNKDVFVGQVLTGQSIKALVSMRTMCSLEVISRLIRAIKSPLVDILESVGGIPSIITSLNSDDLGIKINAMECVLEIGYFGRKEAVEAMLNAGLIKMLVELQRSELGGDWKKSESGFLEKHPFASCVTRFSVQMEVGEGLRPSEKRALKQEILKRVREASDSDAEAATIIAEVLWGSSP